MKLGFEFGRQGSIVSSFPALFSLARAIPILEGYAGKNPVQRKTSIQRSRIKITRKLSRELFAIESAGS
jgi:hypothetical protein